MSFLLSCPACYKEIPQLLFQGFNGKLTVKFQCICSYNIPTDLSIEQFIAKQSFKSEEICHEHTLPAMQYCPDCLLWKCEKCLEHHPSEHETLLSKRLNLACKQHKQRFMEYCKSCQQNLCPNCIESHLTHKRIPLSKIEAPLTLQEDIALLMKTNQAALTKFNDITLQGPTPVYKMNLIKENVNKLFTDYQLVHQNVLTLIDYVYATVSLCKEYPNYQLIQLLKTTRINRPLDYSNYEDFEEKYFVIQQYLLNEYALSNEHQSEAVLLSHTNWIKHILQLKDGQLASCSNDKTIKLWNVDTFKCNGTLYGHTNWIMKMIELFNGNIVSIGIEQGIFIWDVKTYKMLSKIDYKATDIILLSNGLLASIAKETVINFWDLTTYKEKPSIKSIKNTVFEFILETSNHSLVSITKEDIEVWDIKTMKSKRVFQANNKARASSMNFLRELPNGDIVSFSFFDTVIWNITTYQSKNVFKGNWSNCTAINAELCLFSSNKDTLIYNFITNAITTVMRQPMLMNLKMLNEDIGIVIDKKVMKLGNPITMNYKHCRFIGHSRIVNEVIQLKDGRIASCSDDHTIRIWKL